MKSILSLLNLDIPMVFVYVDDFRVGMEPIPYVYIWNHRSKQWTHSPELEAQEVASGMSLEQKTKSTLLTVMNSVHADLTFTVESQSDYLDNHMPTLDTKISLVEEEGKQRVTYTYFEKPMNSRYVYNT